MEQRTAFIAVHAGWTFAAAPAGPFMQSNDHSRKQYLAASSAVVSQYKNQKYDAVSTPVLRVPPPLVTELALMSFVAGVRSIEVLAPRMRGTCACCPMPRCVVFQRHGRVPRYPRRPLVGCILSRA
ncbi:hypothetical protein HYPSUDRAFT_200137 [Hypholoma sublateritium FD-334 SS-4]|uniref:Uncharacterized protein n=1 Tax=Hypholoma sublateritium (strain FD-334 SS-4) TaxID=945553 RepID=A0A0D2P1Q7_HYPSF|nr:hypothetical protein HYPSUDRAFT_200137 [Hypholoma sublateritium FD-334 SS-4]